MPIRYERTDDPPRITVTGEGTFSAQEIIEVLDRMRQEGTWSYPVLCDMRLLTGVPDLADLRRVADAAIGDGPAAQRRGPVAIVVEDPTLYGMACAYAAFAGSERADVFRDRTEAALWLVRTHHRLP